VRTSVIYASLVSNRSRFPNLLHSRLDKLLSSENATVEDLVNAIQPRQENIIQRAQYVTSCKVSFFDEAPAMLID
jgi:hypothetical protein